MSKNHQLTAAAVLQETTLRWLNRGFVHGLGLGTAGSSTDMDEQVRDDISYRVTLEPAGSAQGEHGRTLRGLSAAHIACIVCRQGGRSAGAVVAVDVARNKPQRRICRDGGNDSIVA